MIGSGAYKGPEGPYVNLMGFSTGDWYIVNDMRYGDKVYVTVQNGQQKNESNLVHLSLCDARSWMRENGFSLKEKS